MMDFFVTDAVGRVVMTGRCSEEEFSRQSLPDGMAAHAGKAEIDDRLHGGKLLKRQPSPSIHHRYDWSSGRWVADINSAWSAVRKSRDERLSACDWTALPDAKIDSAKRAEWFAYRQALRDVTKQHDPLDISWPEPPG